MAKEMQYFGTVDGVEVLVHAGDIRNHAHTTEQNVTFGWGHRCSVGDVRVQGRDADWPLPGEAGSEQRIYVRREDDSHWVAMRGNFINLQESPSGIEPTIDGAVRGLIAEEAKAGATP